MSTGTISGQCLEEIETKLISIEILVEATDLATLFTYGFIRPQEVAEINDDLIILGFFTTRVENGRLSNPLGSVKPAPEVLLMEI